MAKFPSKAFAAHLSPIAHRVISSSQSAFIKGRFILEGIACFHEIMHDLKRRNTNAIILKLDFEKAYDCVSWTFLADVLRAKGFDGGYVHRILKLVTGGHIAVSVNGSVGEYFANGRGLRQGDPISPLLFNFMVDALSRILDHAASSGHILHVVSHLIPNGLSHLQYADDTIIIVENNDLCLANLKFLLLCFEALSGLKINFAKSELIATGFSQDAARRAADLMNCLLGSFPLKYLGISISPDTISSKHLRPVVAKVGNRVLPWRGRQHSSAAKVCLINAYLSSLPTYTIGFYLMPDVSHEAMDKH